MVYLLSFHRSRQAKSVDEQLTGILWKKSFLRHLNKPKIVLKTYYQVFHIFDFNFHQQKSEHKLFNMWGGARNSSDSEVFCVWQIVDSSYQVPNVQIKHCAGDEPHCKRLKERKIKNKKCWFLKTSEVLQDCLIPTVCHVGRSGRWVKIMKGLQQPLTHNSKLAR